MKCGESSPSIQALLGTCRLDRREFKAEIRDCSREVYLWV